jgi:hypothetical protein
MVNEMWQSSSIWEQHSWTRIAFMRKLGALSSHLLSRNVKIKMCKTIILPVVLYGCETWSLMLREEHRLRVFENRVLRRIFDLRGMK